ncbi:MAG: nucleotidyltransferase family protein [Comamonas sp.]|nr:nucleotidyltransferase family protein [Comamonas sp.]
MPEATHGTRFGIGAVVLAAGAGRRMGHRPKSLLQRDGEPLLLRQVRLLAAAGCAPIVVVLGHHRQALLRVLEPAQTRYRPLQWVSNPAPEEDPASSLACGLQALPSDTSTILVTLGDQPLLQDGDAQAVLDAWRSRAAGVQLVVPVHGGEPGHPLAFGAVVRAAVQGGASVRAWRRAHPGQVAQLVADHARYTTDVDTPQALHGLEQAHGVHLAWPA